MKVGCMATNYNPSDWPRLLDGNYSQGPSPTDADVVADTLKFGAMIEPLGFDSLWVTEHYGSPYAMNSDPLQWLAYWAGRTEKVDMGTAVLVLPWWDPVRLATEISMLDNLLEGRRFIPGMGRGVAPHEYGGFRIPTENTRGRFHEVLEIIRLALSQEAFEYDGEFYTIPLTTIRPQALHKGRLLDDVWGAFGTPMSARMGAKVGMKQMFSTGESLDEMTRKVSSHNQGRMDAGYEPSTTIAMLYTRCVARADETTDQYYQVQMQSAQNHYGIWKNPGFENVKGYEEYTQRFGTSEEPTDTSLGGNRQHAHQLIGTPDQIIEKIQIVQQAVSLEHLVIHMNHGGIPFEDAKESLLLFAKEVLPVVQKLETPAPKVRNAPASPAGSAP